MDGTDPEGLGPLDAGAGAHGPSDALEALARSEERFRALVQHSADLIVVLDSEMRVRYANPAAASIYGLDPDEQVGRSVVELIHPDDVDRVATRFLSHTVTMKGTGEPLELRLRTADGGWRVVEAIGTNLLDDPAVEGIVVNARDVTQEREAAKAFHDQLAEREAWSRAILTNAFDLVVAVSAQGELVFATPATSDLLGIDSRTRVDRDVFSYIHPDDVATLRAAFKRTVDGRDMHQVLECRVRHGDGTYRWIEVVGTNMLDDPAVGAVVIHGHDVTERHLAEEKSAYQAAHDALTDLPNRHLLHDRIVHALARASRNGTEVAAVFVDLDDFKLVNDSAGHSAGDSVLREVARRLKAASRDADTVARFGGDEFVLLFEHLRDEEQARSIAQRTLSAVFDAPFAGVSGPVDLSASAGVAVSRNADTPDRLLADADAAMYAAKRSGRARVAVFDPGMRSEMKTYLKNEGDLRSALANDEVTAFFQPVVSLADGSFVGAEALARWLHPVRGTLQAADFLPIAEGNGRVDQISSLVVEEACQMLRRVLSRWPGADFSMSCNLSPRQLHASGAIRVLEIAQNAGVDPGQLVIEITETSLLEEDAALLDCVRRLRSAGIRVAADAFGTGSSSLSYLKRIPIAILKIDRTFVDQVGEDPYDTAIVDAVLSMAATLGLEVVAQGVETPEQREQLAQRGCRKAQGFLFGPAIPADEFEEEMASHLPDRS